MTWLRPLAGALALVAVGIAWTLSTPAVTEREVDVEPPTETMDVSPAQGSNAASSREVMTLRCTRYGASEYLTEDGQTMFFGGSMWIPESAGPLCDDILAERDRTRIATVVFLFGAAVGLILFDRRWRADDREAPAPVPASDT